MRFILFCIIAIATLLLVFTPWPPIERFQQQQQQQQQQQITSTANSDLKSKFGIEACSILNNQNLSMSNQVAANSYIPTGRFRKWKPLTHANTKASANVNTSGITHCYINNDLSANEADYFMSGRKCSKEDPTFVNIAFIKDVFPDGQAQTTTSATPEKCVFEIDNDKVNTDSLNAFWGSLGPTDCIQKNKYLIDLGNKLIETRRNLIAKQAQLVSHTESQASQIKSQQNVLQNLSDNVDDLHKDIDDVNHSITLTSKDKNTLQYELDNYVTLCASRKSELETKIATCSAALSQTTTSYNDTSGNLSALQKKMASFQIVFDGLTKDMNNAVNSLNDLQNHYTKSYANYENLIQNESQCQANLNTCDGNLINCNTSLKSDKDNYTVQNNNYIGCQDALNSCKGNDKVCEATSNAWVGQITYYQSQLPPCVSSVESCRGSNIELLTQIQSLNDVYAFDQATYTYTTCKPMQDTINDLGSNVADLLDRCQHAASNNTTNTNLLMSNMAQSATTAANQLTSCQNTVNDKQKAIQALATPGSTVLVDQHIALCPHGTDCRIDSDEQAAKTCPTTCSSGKWLPSDAKNPVYTGSWLKVEAQRSGCYCTYMGAPGDVAIAKAANSAALLAAGSILPPGSYSNPQVVGYDTSFPYYYQNGCSSCVAQNFFMSCACVKNDTSFNASSIDYSDCTKPITNQNGVLTCGGADAQGYTSPDNLNGESAMTEAARTVSKTQNVTITPYEQVTGYKQPI